MCFHSKSQVPRLLNSFMQSCLSRWLHPHISPPWLNLYMFSGSLEGMDNSVLTLWLLHSKDSWTIFKGLVRIWFFFFNREERNSYMSIQMKDVRKSWKPGRESNREWMARFWRRLFQMEAEHGKSSRAWKVPVLIKTKLEQEERSGIERLHKWRKVSQKDWVSS